MRQEFSELRQAIASDIEERFTASEKRLTANLTQVIVQQLETAQQHLEGRLQMHMEDLKGVVTTTAENYGGVLDGIKCELGELNEKMDTKLSDHDHALAGYSQRLAVIERSRRAGRRPDPKG